MWAHKARLPGSFKASPPRSDYSFYIANVNRGNIDGYHRASLQSRPSASSYVPKGRFAEDEQPYVNISLSVHFVPEVHILSFDDRRLRAQKWFSDQMALSDNRARRVLHFCGGDTGHASIQLRLSRSTLHGAWMRPPYCTRCSPKDSELDELLFLWVCCKIGARYIKVSLHRTSK